LKGLGKREEVEIGEDGEWISRHLMLRN
jgi:hypothetical protein